MPATRLSGIAAVLALVSVVAHAQDSAARVAEARQLIGQEKYAEAVAILEPVVKDEPANGGAWFALGQAERKLGNFDAAAKALEAATATPAIAGFATRERFLVAAEQGDKDGAAKWLGQARGAIMVDFSGLAMDPAVQNLKGDARFADFFPGSGHFDKPFAEGHAVLHDWHGEDEKHEFGWEARNAGDVDGDGVNDAVVSATQSQPGASSAGRVYVYSGKTGEQLWSRFGQDGDLLGTGIEAAGDVDADGTPDVIAGAPGVGEVIVYSGASGDTLLRLAPEGVDASWRFGTAVAGVDDVDDDGHADFLVGAPGVSLTEGGGEGAVFLYSGQFGEDIAVWNGEPGDALGSVVAGYTDKRGTWLVMGAPGAGEGDRGRVYVCRGPLANPALVFEADETGRQYGAMFASVVGDVNADGTPDIYSSDWADGDAGPFAGKVYVHSGKDGKRLLTLTGEKAGDGFGIGPARAGDVNGDGHADLIVGAWQQRNAAHSGGKIYLYSGKDGSLMKAWTGRIAGETLGFDADGMGDVNGDGADDFLVTSAWSLVNGPRSGRTLILSGR